MERAADQREFREDMAKCITENGMPLAGAHFATGPEILPGWSLRLNPTKDGAGYDVMLEDTTDKACGYAAVTDERGVIRQARAIELSDLDPTQGTRAGKRRRQSCARHPLPRPKC